jgi:NADPH-dependent F420 reductase
MRISILGGTGEFGEGLAIRWSRAHEVIIGSRFKEKAEKEAKEYAIKAASAYLEDMKGNIIGMENSQAASIADVIVLTIPAQYLYNFLETLKDKINKDAMIISPVVPITKKDLKFFYDPAIIKQGATSAAEEIAKILQTDKVIAALHTIPAKKIADPYHRLNYDVPFCTDNKNIIDQFVKLIKDLSIHLNPLYVGGLDLASLVESLTLTILNISINSKIWNLSIKFVE